MKKMCKSEDMAGLEAGHKLWKVRKKHFIGITWKHRKFRLNFSDLCIHYGEDKVSKEELKVGLISFLIIQLPTNLATNFEITNSEYSQSNFPKFVVCFDLVLGTKTNNTSRFRNCDVCVLKTTLMGSK